MVILYKLLAVLRMNRTVDRLIQSVEQAMTMVWTFLIFITLMLIGITVVANNIWGAHILNYVSFSDAFMAVVFLQMGLTNFDELVQYNFIWSYIYFIIYVIFIVYILVSSFMIVFIDSYRRM